MTVSKKGMAILFVLGRMDCLLLQDLGPSFYNHASSVFLRLFPLEDTAWEGKILGCHSNRFFPLYLRKHFQETWRDCS